MENKEIAIVEEQVSKCIAESASIVVTSQEEYDSALLLGKKVATLAKMIDDKEKAITKPINDSLKKIRDMFRPFKAQVEAVSNDLKAKRTAWMQAEDAKRLAEEARITARVEKGTMKESTAAVKLANMTTPQTGGGMTSVLRMEVTDKAAIPMEYLIVDEAAIKAAYRDGKEVSGTRCWYEKVARN